jgi:hypothetical protein
MDAPPDSDQLFLAYLHCARGNDALTGTGERLDERSDSAMSLASTIAFDIPPTTVDAHPRHLIKAFCAFNGLFVTIAFPSEADGWVYRYDLGGQSQHRWDYDDSIVLLNRHTLPARRPLFEEKMICRNCVMKDDWRRECMRPENAFFICSMSATKDPTDAVNKVT